MQKDEIMDFGKLDRQNWLKKWREKESLSPETVDGILSWSVGMTEHYECLGLMRTPGCDLWKLVQLYRVPVYEIHEAIFIESEKLRNFIKGS